jgi:hypothetical protein
MTGLQLEPLSLEEVQQLVADTLPGAKAEVVQPLSALVREKTGGNPFFLLQFMLTLHQDGLLVHTPEGTWQWNAEGVLALASELAAHFWRERKVPSLAESCAGKAREAYLRWGAKGKVHSYVKRTREHVLIGDASQPHPFSADVWFTRGGARSVL